MSLLDTIGSPADLRKLPISDLPALAGDIRALLLQQVSKAGGHLAPNLGVVELTIALHYAYNTPVDKLVWDVGHQAYAHKILTGRRAQFDTLRQYKGMSGFPRRDESEYDTVSGGHASTSISAALGIALARDLRKETFDVVAVIGDGSMSGGLAFEGMNNLGCLSTKMTVVLNDNRMSISHNVGAMSRYLTRLITDRRYNRMKNEVWDLLGHFSDVGLKFRKLVSNVDETLKHFVIPGKLFEDMGLRYLGPVDGHNIAELVEVLKFVKAHQSTPALIHVITTKGKGYGYAEADATKFHGVSTGFSLSTGTMAPKSSVPTFSEVFGKTLVDIAKDRPDVVAITAAMPDGTGLAAFREAYPNRFFDVGIAEGHAVTFAAGLALGGMRPVVALYSTFLQRAYDQIVHDVAIDSLPVVFCIDRAGLVGDDGPTHHGMFDLSFLRTIPNCIIMAPADENELRHMVYTALNQEKGPVCIRYPRGSGTGVPLGDHLHNIPIGQPEVLREGSTVAIIAVGDCCSRALEACEQLAQHRIAPTVINARFVKPLDVAWYNDLFTRYSVIVTLENNTLEGGFGSAIAELLSSPTNHRTTSLLRLGFTDAFIPHGDVHLLLRDLGLDATGIARAIVEWMKG